MVAVGEKNRRGRRRGGAVGVVREDVGETSLRTYIISFATNDGPIIGGDGGAEGGVVVVGGGAEGVGGVGGGAGGGAGGVGGGAG